MARTKKEVNTNEEVVTKPSVKKTTPKKETESGNAELQALLEQNKLLMERLAQLEEANKNQVTTPTNETVAEQPKRMMRQTNKSALEFKDKKRMIPLVCMVNHRVGYKCKTNNMFIIWDGQGDEHEISIEEAQYMFAESQEYLKNWLLADDEEFVEVMGLKDLYELIFEIENIEKFYSQRMIQIEKKLDAMPNSIRQELLNRTAVEINDGSLNTPNVLAIIKLLRDKYNVELDV